MNSRFMQTLSIIRKDIRLELKQLYVFNGILLYLVSTVFVCYLSFQGRIDLASWNALYWVIILFVAINAILKGFLHETDGLMLYYYSIVHPQAVITAKIIYNAVFLGVLALAGLLIYAGFMGNPIQNTGLYLINMLLGVFGFSTIMTMVSAIAARSKNNFTLMGVLSFPLVLPLILVLIKVSLAAIGGATMASQAGNLFVILLLTAIAFVLSVLLFPFIWKE